ncbi:hypothetical protein BYT27DRAFT_7264863 [Phlegmacium glaucopus]|nr:hypothetical protein BYT27DRAFT_7264863 [Phlegmacium glaucopus]
MSALAVTYPNVHWTLQTPSTLTTANNLLNTYLPIPTVSSSESFDSTHAQSAEVFSVDKYIIQHEGLQQRLAVTAPPPPPPLLHTPGQRIPPNGLPSPTLSASSRKARKEDDDIEAIMTLSTNEDGVYAVDGTRAVKLRFSPAYRHPSKKPIQPAPSSLLPSDRGRNPLQLLVLIYVHYRRRVVARVEVELRVLVWKFPPPLPLRLRLVPTLNCQISTSQTQATTKKNHRTISQHPSPIVHLPPLLPHQHRYGVGRQVIHDIGCDFHCVLKIQAPVLARAPRTGDGCCSASPLISTWTQTNANIHIRKKPLSSSTLPEEVMSILLGNTDNTSLSEAAEEEESKTQVKTKKRSSHSSSFSSKEDSYFGAPPR